MGTGTPATGGFGERLLRLRTGAGLSQEALAHLAGVSVRALSDMERGRSRGPQRRTVEALAAALELDATGAGELERAASLGRPRTRRATTGDPSVGEGEGAGPAGQGQGADPAGEGGGVPGAPEAAAYDRSRAGEDAGHDQSRSAQDVGHDSCRAADDAEHDRTRAADDAEHDRTRAADDAEHDTSRAAADAEHYRSRAVEDGGHGRTRAEQDAGHGPAPAGAPRPGPAPYHSLALPRDLPDFTARGPALARLVVLAEQAGGGGHPPVAVVSGQPGLGKTAFAVHAAHALAPYFPDGQFHLDLRGMDPQPTRPRDALARLLHALGAAVPAATEDRSGLLRSVLRDKRVLLLLDNAADEEQVRPLLPGQGTSLTLVTSRQALAGLEAVHRTELALLRREEAVELLTRIVGPKRVGREGQAVRDLAELCGHLPLAVRIAGQRLAARPGDRIAKLVGQLAEQGDRLDTLRAGSLEVRAAFALSYRQLSPGARTVFRRSCLAAGPDFGPETAALLADLPRRRAARCLQDLTDAGLLQPHPTADRYRYHDLLALYAAEQLAEEDGPEEVATAEDRAARWALRRATAAALNFDADHPPEPRTAADGDPDPATAPAGPDQARTWLEQERAQWLDALRRAQAAGDHRRVVDAAEAMHWFSDRTMHWELWAEVFRRGADSARALGSRREEAVQLNYLAWAYNVCLYDHAAALTTARAALDVARETGDEVQVGWAMGYAAGALNRLGRTDEAIAEFRRAADHLAVQPGAQSRLAELTALNLLGQLLRQVGRAAEALAIHRRSEARCRAGVPGKPQEVIGLYLAATRQHIGNDLAALERWQEAEAPLSYALAHFEASRMPAWSEAARLDIGIVLRRLGRRDEARAALTAAHEALVRLNNPRQLEAAAELRGLDAAGRTV